MSTPISPKCRWDVLPTPTQPYSRFDSIVKLNKALGTHPMNPLTMAQLNMATAVGGSYYTGDYAIRLISLPSDEPLIGVAYQKDAMMTRLLKRQ